MPDGISLFEQYLKEAPDDPPDAGQADAGAPPDIPDGAESDTGPPDMGDAGMDDSPDSGGSFDDGPPDMGGDDFGDGMEDGDEGGEEGGENQEEPIEGLDEKVSAIMNQRLYQSFLAMLNTIGSQISQVKENSDILHALSAESIEITESLQKLDENVRLYLKNIFMEENYSKNLLFFNKCLNLLKLLNDVFTERIRKGIKDAE